MERIRSRHDFISRAYVITDREGNILNEQDATYTREYIHDYNNGRLRPYSPCGHYRAFPSDFSHTFEDGTNVVYSQMGDVTQIGDVGNFVSTNVASFVKDVKFDFEKNNDFEIINFLAEIDDTLAMFSTRFLRQLATPSGYGAVKWGVLPFYRDLVGVFNSLWDLFGGRIAAELSTGKPVKAAVGVSYTDSITQHRVNGVIRLNGVISVPPPNKLEWLAIFLDEIGLHPDLKSAWDLVPYSFLVDYVAPIGDILESCHPRGWYKPPKTFQGSATFDLQVSHAVSNFGHLFGHLRGDYYKRTTGSVAFSLGSESIIKTQPSYKAPKLSNLMDAGYVYSQIRGARKRR